MNVQKILRSVVAGVFLAALVGLAASAQALPLADIHYQETDLGSGQWQYTYTVTNLSDPGYNLYDVFFFLMDTGITASLVSPVPTGWDGFTGWEVAEIFSYPSNEILAGSSLSGFTLTFDAQVGDLAYQAMFTNPDDPEFPVFAEGITHVPTVPATVPEPGSVLLVAAGISILGLLRRHMAKKTS